MANNQSKHVVPCKKYDKLLVGNGTDKIFSHIISDDFAFKAKQDGVVESIDPSTNIMIVRYKDGNVDFVELDPKISKNGGGGFYIANTLVTKLSEGSKFKKDDILASNKSYFDQSSNGEAIYKAGTLTKVALASGYYTYEDSSMVSKALCKDMGTEVVMKDEIILGPNSNIDHIVKVGDAVKVGDPLIVFDTSYGDEGINKMLASMDDTISSQISELGKKKLKATHAGVIEDITVYYTVELDQLSPTLQKTVKGINAKNIKKKKLISKYTDPNSTNIILPPTDKIDTQFGKVKSVSVGEGVYIEFFIKYYDEMFIGDKIVFFAATKSVICDVMPDGKEAFSEYRPEEPLGAFLSDSSVLKRMVGSIQYNLFENKLLIELKRQCKEILEGKRK